MNGKTHRAALRKSQMSNHHKIHSFNFSIMKKSLSFQMIPITRSFLCNWIYVFVLKKRVEFYGKS